MVHRMCLVVVLLFVVLTASASADVYDDNPTAATLDGTKITVVTTKPGAIGSHKVLTIRDRKRPSVTARCLPPGVTKPQAC